ncbi:hypothetical protein AX17_000314 [Amanita inopinata Kibby_2008]|nr:hypothetical protein AX17_000314 [Amanita inopinata Kibby_2008]
MKHGIAFRKFSRTSSHRMLMLRNLVTSLLEHEQIRTTLPKARDAARLAEKIITLGKKGDRSSHSRAAAFLLKPNLVPKLFGTLASRYSERPGGYTRIHKYGHRMGDNAPQAILELVDNPRDLRWEMTSRAIGREILTEKLRNEQPTSIVNNGCEGVQQLLQESCLSSTKRNILRPMTRWNLQKVLKFRPRDAPLDMSKKIGNHMEHLLATPMALRTIHEELKEKNSVNRPPRLKAGETVPGETRAALDLARGVLGHRRSPPKGLLLNMRTLFGQKQKNA